jgi:hypothetical protein
VRDSSEARRWRESNRRAEIRMSGRVEKR